MWQHWECTVIVHRRGPHCGDEVWMENAHSTIAPMNTGFHSVQHHVVWGVSQGHIQPFIMFSFGFLEDLSIMIPHAVTENHGFLYILHSGFVTCMWYRKYILVSNPSKWPLSCDSQSTLVNTCVWSGNKEYYHEHVTW